MKGRPVVPLLLLLALVALGSAAISPRLHDSATKQLLDELKGDKPTTRSSSTQHPEIVFKTSTPPPVRRTTSSHTTDSELSSILSIPSGKDMLVDRNRPGDDEDSNNEKIQEELAKVIKAQAQKKSRPAPRVRVSNSSSIAAAHGSYYNASADNKALKALLEAEDMVYNEEMDDAYDEDEDDDDDYDNDNDDDDDTATNTADDDDDDDDEDDNTDDDDDDDEINEDEEVMAGCPDYCRCAGQYVAAVTARCSKLLDDQGFGSGIAHLKIENAGDIRLGPHALRRLGLRQLESISIVDTKILELDRTAFDGLKELFVVNLTHNGLTGIHPDTFQNNSQLSLLTISGNPLKLSNSRRDYLLDAPSVTELDFSNNQLSRLPRRAFAKMPNLAYISLKHNRLSNLEKDLFAPLDSLVELDLSNNLLSDLPSELFKGKGLQTLKMAGNSLSSLSSVKVPKLTILDVSTNRLKSITKDDLDGVPNLDELYLSGNNLKRIHPHAFSDLDQLSYLDLRNNNLVNLSEHHFRANSRLQVLLLSDNPELVSLPVFRTNAQEFERFSIYRFECENCGLSFIEIGTFDAMPAMTKLNLARNKLTGVPKDLMRSLSSLRELDLSMNRLDRLEDNMFEGATSLTKLSLAMNSFVSGLRVTPFLKTPNLLRLDLSYCGMQKIWSQLNIPIKSLRFLVLHKNRLTRLTVEELRVVPNLSGLDVSRNPLHCDEDLSAAVQWLTDRNVIPTESLRDGSSALEYGYQDPNNQELSSSLDSDKGWTDLAKRLCDSWEGGPPLRPAPKKPTKQPKKPVAAKDKDAEEPLGPFLKFDFGGDEIEITNKLDYGLGHSTGNDEIEAAWNGQDRDREYDEDDLTVPVAMPDREYNYAYNLWPFMVGALVTITVFLLSAHLIVCLAKRRGRGPVMIRTPMILRPGLIDSKNCGLVYKPLQEEIATPHMPKRGSFYSSSTFHYDKIVPESV